MLTIVHDMDVRNEGRAEGRAEGREEGRTYGYYEGILRIVENIAAQKKLSIEEACSICGIDTDEYWNAKEYCMGAAERF